MSIFNFKTAALAVVAGASLSGCAYGPYGGVGVGVGYGNGYYDPYYGSSYYGSGYYGGLGYGYGMPGYGWYDGYYYPGSGYYVYDRYRNPYRWSDAQQRYWQWRQRGAPRATRGTGAIIQNWADFQNGPRATTNNVRQRSVSNNHTYTEPSDRAQTRRVDRQQVHRERRVDRTEAQQERRANRGRNRRTSED